MSITHPLEHIFKISKDWKNAILNFSVYSYTPQSIVDDRRPVTVLGNDLNVAWFKDLLKSLKSNEEIAFHSLVVVDGIQKHLPMIDFTCSRLDLAHAKNCLTQIFSNQTINGFVFFDSGRSMHAYGSSLISQEQWIKFLGLLLLVNTPTEKPIIDTRWIGHRLLGGYSSLRLTCNSGNYLKMPEYIE